MGIICMGTRKPNHPEVKTMRIETDKYQIAPLYTSEEAVEVIREAESVIAGLTGNKVTLIAYEKTADE